METYMEDTRNNIKIVGLPEDQQKEKSWDDTEELVKGVIKEKFKVDVEVKIERSHRAHVLHLKSWKMVQGRKFRPIR